MMTYIDTHSHLYDEAFAEDMDAAFDRAALAGVGRIVLPDIDSSSRESMFSLAERHPGAAFPCLGLHPTSVNASWREEIEKLSAPQGTEIWAIGEIGMDLYWSKDFLEEQKEVFAMQLEMAHSMDLPVIIHSREATGPILEILEKHRHSDTRGVFHAFSGSIETFRRLTSMGDWYAGIGGVVTYRKASIAETVKSIPLERILLETDSPYLTPVPKRGGRNESSYIPYIAGKIAEQKNIALEEVAEVTTENAEKLFGI